jgi:WD40 repeat protein/serine/threonine protein kinase
VSAEYLSPGAGGPEGRAGPDAAPDAAPAPSDRSAGPGAVDTPPAADVPTADFVPDDALQDTPGPVPRSRRPGAGAPPRPAGPREPDEWRVGDTILGLYQVLQVHRGGGMSLVYRVHHPGWGIDLALKSPRPQYFRTERHKRLFEREAETWVRLGLHPNTASCYYVRRIGEIPRIFAEYVAGGSLAEWIRDGRLYAGGRQEALARVLDVAVQVAWGLHRAHGRGLVHRDVKPANVLLTAGGAAKVTDFGLSKGRPEGPPAGGEPPGAPAGLVSAGGLTLAYCSPEQHRCRPVSRATDVWSWAVSVLEMFVGQVAWTDGPRAAEALEWFLAGGGPARVEAPPAVADLLRECLRERPEDRPADMEAIADRLRRAYAEAAGRAHPRPAPRPADALAPGLNNRAASMLDLGKRRQAEALWQRALALEPLHPESTYNLGLLRLRAGQLRGDDLLGQLRQASAARPGEWLPLYLLAQAHLERGEWEAAQAALAEVGPDDRGRPEVRAAAAEAAAGVRGAVRPARILGGSGGRARAVLAAALTRHGKLGLTGGEDRALRLWDLRTGRCLCTLEGHGGAVTAACLAVGGRRALSGSADGSLRVWAPGSGRCLRTLAAHPGGVTAVAVTADWKYALSAGADRALRVWDLAAGACLRELEAGGEPAGCVDLDAVGLRAVSGGGGWGSRPGAFPVRVWDLAAGACLRELPGHANGVAAVRLSGAGDRALSGGADGVLRVWDVDSGAALHALGGHPGGVVAAAFDPARPRALAAAEDGTLRVWDLAEGRCLRTLEARVSGPAALAVSGDGCHVLSGGPNGTAALWRLDPPRPSPVRLSEVFDGEAAAARRREFERAREDAREALARGDAASAARHLRRARTQPGYERTAAAVRQWCALYTRLPRKALNAAWEARTFTGHRAGVTAVALTPDGRLAVSASKDRTLRLWDVEAGGCLSTFRGHRRGVASLYLSPDGRHLASAGRDAAVLLWDLRAGKLAQEFRGHAGPVAAAWVSADGRYALSAGRDGALKTWDAETGRCVRSLTAHEGGAHTLGVSADERHALTAGGDRALRLWDVASGRCLRELRGGRRGPSRAWMQGALALSAGAESSFRLWDLGAWRPLREFQGHADRVTAACLSADGRYALSASRDQTLRLWRADTAQGLRTFEGHAGHATAACFSADGRYALSGGEDGWLRLWLLDWELENRAPADWDEAARPHLEAFLTLHTPRAGAGWLPGRRGARPLARSGRPSWDEADFADLLRTLGCAGLGWLRPDGVRLRLEEMAEGWRGPPPSPYAEGRGGPPP